MATNPLHNRARRHSLRIYALLGAALLILGIWGSARIAVCWGRYSGLGTLACHSQWGTFLGLVAAVTTLIFLARDLSAPHRETLRGQRFQTTRAVWRGYGSLDRPASLHVAASTILLVASVIAFAWLVFLSSVRF
jgi:hypothetical protein